MDFTDWIPDLTEENNNILRFMLSDFVFKTSAKSDKIPFTRTYCEGCIKNPIENVYTCRCYSTQYCTHFTALKLQHLCPDAIWLCLRCCIKDYALEDYGLTIGKLLSILDSKKNKIIHEQKTELESLKNHIMVMRNMILYQPNSDKVKTIGIHFDELKKRVIRVRKIPKLPRNVELPIIVVKSNKR